MYEDQAIAWMAAQACLYEVMGGGKLACSSNACNALCVECVQWCWLVLIIPYMLDKLCWHGWQGRQPWGSATLCKIAVRYCTQLESSWARRLMMDATVTTL